MNINKQLLSFIYDEVGTEADAVVKRIEVYQDINRRYARCLREIEELKNKYDSDVKSLHTRIRGIQDNCSHPDFSFYGDAAGGHDSYNKCNICGKEL